MAFGKIKPKALFPSPLEVTGGSYSQWHTFGMEIFMFPPPLEMTGVSNSEYEDNISVLTRFPYPFEETGGSYGVRPSSCQPLRHSCFRPLSR